MFKGGKADGKGTKGKGHLLPRTRITAEKFTGHCSGWKGNYGWIKPAEEVEHEKASLHNGALFVSKDCLEGSTELTPGAPCEFHIWEDESGLGAEEVIETGAVDPTFEIPAPKGKGKSGPSMGASPAKGFGKAATPGWQKGAEKGWGGVVVPGKGAAAAWGKEGAAKGAWGQEGMWGKEGAAKGAWGKASPVANGCAGPYGKGKDGKGGFDNGFAKGGCDKGKGKDGKGKDGKKGVGHKLPRTRITAEKFTGTVVEWKGKYGWIKPAEEIEHALAAKNKGNLFASISDLEGGITELTADANVEFHIWEDPTGLGAEEILQF